MQYTDEWGNKYELKSIYKRHLERGLKDAGFEDVREVKQGGKFWFMFYNYGVFN